ncbi:MAG TPA: transposase [Fimbriiglobus sp.]|jgi:putative transposase
MPNYRRNYVPGGTYFFTLVTANRRPILGTDAARQFLREAIRDEQSKRPFDLVAIVLLPDHLHAVWTLPPGDVDYSTRWRKIKERFTTAYLAAGGVEADVSESREAHGERGVWQRRFWEHTIEDEDELKRCIDYIHWNPVKHGLVARVADWPWSSFHRYVDMGEYNRDWGTGRVVPDIPGAEWE